MPSIRRSRGSGRQEFAHLALLLAACVALALLSLTVFGDGPVQANPPNPPHGDGVHPGGGNGGLDNSGHTLHPNPPPPPPPPPDENPPPKDPPPKDPPPRDPPPDQTPSGGGGGSTSSGSPSTGLSGVAGAHTSGHSGGRAHHAAQGGQVLVKPHQSPTAGPAHHDAKAQRSAKGGKAAVAAPPAAPVAAPSGNPNRSTFADRLLSPTDINLSAENLGQGGCWRCCWRRSSICR